MSKPKQSDYKASPSEKANASVALAQKNYFDDVYLPRQIQMTENAFQDEDTLIETAEGRANADTMQTLTSNPNRNAVASVNTEADLASALSGMVAQGTDQGYIGARGDQVGSIKAANKMMSDTQTGLSRIAKIEGNRELSIAQANLNKSLGFMKGATNLGKGAAYGLGYYKGSNQAPEGEDEGIG